MMSTVRGQLDVLASQPAVRDALRDAARSSPALVEEALQIQKIPAPTFGEAQRAAYVLDYFRQRHLSDVARDDVHCVYARIPGANPDAPAVLVCAHVDTVFSAETDLSIRQNGHLLYGPGLGDNSIGVAALLALPEVLAANGLQPDADVWLAATVCEEGLGNLLGMERALERLRDRVGLVVVVEGMALGHVFHEGLGVRRLRVSSSGPGGHSWLNRDRPSAIHSLLEIGIALSHVPLPEDAPASLNVGLVEGGTSVNSIAAHASLCLDLRSESSDALDELEARVVAAIQNCPLPPEISVSVEAIGERPTGSIARNHPLVRACKAALQLAGVKQVVYEVASTEANLPLANGLPAVCVGITTGANAHSPDEYVDTRHVAKGMQQLVLLTLAAAQHSAEWAAWDNVG